MNNEVICLNSPTASQRLILLHGWGADAEDLIPIGEILRNDFEDCLEIVSLRAPEFHPQGIGRQWYSLYPADWLAVPSAIKLLKDRIKNISSQKIPLEKTFLLGFSQGAAMALNCGCELPLAGLICCSGYSHPDWIPPKNSPPVFISHGIYDEVVPVDAAKNTLNLLNQSNLNARLELFEGAHEIPESLISKFKLFLEQGFKNSL